MSIAGRGWVGSVLLLAFTAALAVTLATLSLTTAFGVVHLGGDDYATEFAQMGWWAAGWLLVVPVGLLGWARPVLAPLGVLAATVPPFVVAYVSEQRALDSGWSQGLDVFGYIYAAAMTLGFVGAALLGWQLSRRSTVGSGGGRR